MKEAVLKLPVIGPMARMVRGALRRAFGENAQPEFRDSGQYWEERYLRGQNSGSGSYNHLAEFKAEVLNSFVRDEAVRSVIEFGSGDGNQLELAEYPRYTGFDVSDTAIDLCRQRFKADSTKDFHSLDDHDGQRADLVLSLDVIYHLVEDEVFDDYMRRLFQTADRFVVVYSSDTDEQPENQSVHVRHRKFSDWIANHEPTWSLMRHVPNRYPFAGDSATGSFADFFIYSKS